MNAGEELGRAVWTLLTEVDALQEALHLTMSLLQLVLKEKIGRVKEFAEERGIPMSRDENAGNLVFEIPRKHLFSFADLAEPTRTLHVAQSLTPRSALVTLVSQYDAFLGRVLRTAFVSRHELLRSSDRKMPCCDLWTFDSIEEARELAVDREIESFLRESHIKQFDILERILDLPLRKDLGIWPIFVELTERRNLFVHCDAVVSSQYIDVCVREGVQLGEGIKRGDELSVEPEYFEHACKCIREIGSKLWQVVWRKLFPEDIDVASNNLIAHVYELLLRDEYEVVIALADFALAGLPQRPTEEGFLIHNVNKAIALKQLGKTDEADSLLSSIEWSTKALRFQLAHAVLRDEYGSAAELVRQIGSKNEVVSKDAYARWPLFEGFRESEEFLKAYIDAFGVAFGKEAEDDTFLETLEGVEELQEETDSEGGDK